MRSHLSYLLPLTFLVFIGTVGFIGSSDQNQTTSTKIKLDPNMKIWSDTDKLTWSDFKGKKDKRNQHQAVTTATLKTKPVTFTENKVQYEIVALFDKKKSWTVSKSEALLVHEQIHFDIAELVLRRMRKKFLNHKLRSLDGVNKMINSTFTEASKEHIRLNKEYDKETDHSRNKPKQLLWQERIERELKTMKDYASTTVTITK